MTIRQHLRYCILMSLFKSNIHHNCGFRTTFEEQNKVISYLHPLTPYRSLILCFGLGKGKTYSAACLAHLYGKMGYKTLYVSRSLTSLSSFATLCEQVELDLRSSTSHKPSTMTYNKLYSKGCESNEYGLIILDEVHNLRENASRYDRIKDIFSKLYNTKLLIMSGTPMVDSKDEFKSIVNLTGESKPHVLFGEENDVNDIEVNYVGKKIGNNILFTSQMKGKQLEAYKDSFLLKENAIYSDSRQASMSCAQFYDETIDICEQSCKVAKFLSVLDPKKKTVVFCFYISRGINFIAKALESVGHKKWDESGDFNGPCYSIIDGSTSQAEQNLIMNTFNNIANSGGEIINVLIGSSVLEEAITLFRVRELHIMCPFWNSTHAEQSIGRVNRYGSHVGLSKKDRNINIYLHAAYGEKEDEEHSQDIKMWNISSSKKVEIIDKLNELKLVEKVKSDYLLNIPEVNDRDIICHKNIVWDFSRCFQTNKFKISWCKIDHSKCVGYDKDKKLTIYGYFPSDVVIHYPKEEGYTMWRSCVDNALRLTFIDKTLTNKNKRRGKIFDNINVKEKLEIAKSLGLESADLIIPYLKDNNRYFERQIKFLNDLRQD